METNITYLYDANEEFSVYQDTISGNLIYSTYSSKFTVVPYSSLTENQIKKLEEYGFIRLV